MAYFDKQIEFFSIGEKNARHRHNDSYIIDKLTAGRKELKNFLYEGRTYICRSDLDEEGKIPKRLLEVDASERSLRALALILRKLILDSKTRELPKQNIKISDIVEGESQTPQELLFFMQYLLNGARYQSNEANDRRVESICRKFSRRK